MKVTGRIEVFQGRNGLIGKIPAFDKDGNFTGAVYMPIEVKDLEVPQGVTITLMLNDAFLNCSTAKKEDGIDFTHLHIRAVKYEELSRYEAQVEKQPKSKKVAKSSKKKEDYDLPF